MGGQGDDPVAGLEAVGGPAGGDGGDSAFGFLAEDLGVGRGVEAGAEVAGEGQDGSSDWDLRGRRGGARVDVVHARELVLDEHFPRLQGGEGQVGAVLENLDAAFFLHDDAAHGLREGGGGHGAGCGGEMAGESSGAGEEVSGQVGEAEGCHDGDVGN